MPEIDNPDDWVPEEFKDDTQFLHELRAGDIELRLWAHKIKLLEKCIRNTMVVAEVRDPDIKSLTQEVSQLIGGCIHLTGARIDATGEGDDLDLMDCVELLLLAMLRISKALNSDFRRKMDPTSSDDPEDTLII